LQLAGADRKITKQFNILGKSQILETLETNKCEQFSISGKGVVNSFVVRTSKYAAAVLSLGDVTDI